MKNLLVSALALAAITGLQGCGSLEVTPECKLEGDGAGRCMSMQDAYAAVQSGRRGDVSVFDSPGASKSKGAAPGAPGAAAYGYLGNYPAPDQATPVFQQPKVFRPWLAPYVDADGVLHSGEYAYFNTPGAWNYGELRRPGAGAAVMGPVKPWETGFLPGANKPAAAAAPRAGAPSAPPAPAAPTGPQVPGEVPVSGITQPYQRLN